MTKLIALITTTAGSSAGWWVGAHVGIMTAFFASMKGFAVGLWAARRIAHHLLA